MNVDLSNTKLGNLLGALHNSRDRTLTKTPTKTVLVEVNHFFSHHCALPILLEALSKEHNFDFVPYIPLASWDEQINTLQFVLSLYRQMGMAGRCVKAEPSALHIEEARCAVVEDFHFFNGEIWNLTDFVYDELPLGVHLVETLIQQFSRANFIQSIDTVRYAIGLISIYNWWRDFFKTNAVGAIIASHYCYEFSLPLLAGSKRELDLFSWTHCNLIRINSLLPLPSLNANLILPDSARKHWGKSPNTASRKCYILRGKEELESRTRGVLLKGFDNDPRVMSSERCVSEYKIDKSDDRICLAIWSHAFSDAPNTMPKDKFGFLCNPLLSVRRLLEIFPESDFNVYVKTHPNPLEQDDAELNVLLKSFKDAKRLPNYLSVAQAREAGVDCIISGWGTVCFEARYLNIPVLTYTDFLGLAKMGIVDLIDINKTIITRQIVLDAIQRQLAGANIDLLVEQYVIHKYGWAIDLTCSGIEVLSRNSNDGLYTLNAFNHWADNFDLDRYYQMLPRVSEFFKSSEVVLSPFDDF